uniref:Uncharacterized protein LOC100187010 n=1 Tax=Phallusia mammillata TaxID=59560 RepID=A0A6F9DJ95_9ASCI|nr:uncharacterized protein LOC100187010 [Phallusia mammillata]
MRLRSFIIGFHVLLFVHRSVSDRPEIKMTTSKPFTALSDDLAVKVTGASEGLVVFLRYENDTFPLTAQIITRSGQKTVALAFDCGYFWRLGEYRVTLTNSSDISIYVTMVNVTATRYPSIELNLKSFHKVQTTDVQATVVTSGHICQSTIVGQYKTQLVMTNHNTADSTVLESSFPPKSSIFTCQTFSRPGHYSVSLVISNKNETVKVAESGIMKVDWSTEYDLELEKNQIDCTDEKDQAIEVRIRRPACIREQDAIIAVAPLDNGTEMFLARRRIGRKDQVTFSCRSLLQRANTSGVCFHYLSSGVITKTACRPMRGSSTTAFNINGAWSRWSDWSKCQRPCPHAMWKRMRSCDNPEPFGSGRICGGNGSSTGYGDIQVERQFQPDHTADDFCSQPPQDNTTTTVCTCGCFVHAENSEFSFASPLSGQCSGHKEIVWNVFTSPDHVIRFRVTDFQTFYGEAVTISEARGTVTVSFVNQTITTDSHLATVRYLLTPEATSIDSCGFVLSYKSVARSSLLTYPIIANQDVTTAPLPQPQDKTWSNSIVKNPVLVSAIGGCVVIIFILCFVIARYRCKRYKESRSRKLVVSTKCRLTTPPDGKSCSNIDTESDRPQPLGETAKTDVDLLQSPKPRAAYYLAQRQLQLMKKSGQDASSQLYTSSCINSDQIHEQRDLLFGSIDNRDEQVS